MPERPPYSACWGIRSDCPYYTGIEPMMMVFMLTMQPELPTPLPKLRRHPVKTWPDPGNRFKRMGRR